MNIMIFDTETTSLDKPFCYNVGYIIVDSNTAEVIIKRDFVVEQVWHNPMLFTTAYYADKKELYIKSMRSRKTTMDKFGYICQQMIRDFRNYQVEVAFAYNSSFDEKVFNFNCDWFKCINPFDEVPIFDIRGYVHNFLVDDDYKAFCEKNERFTETGNYSTTAETVFQFVTGETDFEEAHTALNDAEIETEILFTCLERGAVLGKNYKAKRSIDRPQEKTLHIRTAEQTDYYFDYYKIRINRDKTEIKLG